MFVTAQPNREARHHFLKTANKHPTLTSPPLLLNDHLQGLLALPPHSTTSISAVNKPAEMFKTVIALLATVAILPAVLAQDPIFVPFEWDQVPLTASSVGSSGGQTTYALIDGPSGGVVPGPATLIQGPSGASMIYAAPSTTLSGVCNLVSPVAVCTLNVQESGAPLPGTGAGTGGTGTNTSKKGGSTGGTTGGTTGGGGSGSGAPGSSAGAIFAMTTLALGFCVSLAFVR